MNRSFTKYVDKVLLQRDVTPDYAAKVRYCNRRFVRWLGYDPGIDGVNSDRVNEFLAELQKIGLRPDTVAGYRRAVLVVWNAAYQCGHNDVPPLRVRKIRCPREVVEAFEHGALRSLLAFVSNLADYLPNGVQRSTFWAGAIHAAYSTGLRRGDLLRVKRVQIATDGVAYVLQSKTGYPVTVRFSEPAIAAIDRMRVDERALPWPYHENALSRQFRRLVKEAGLCGQFRWLRRSAGSYAEREGQGNGTRLLGHRSERIFRDHYADPNIIQRKPPEPPPIGGGP